MNKNLQLIDVVTDPTDYLDAGINLDSGIEVGDEIIVNFHPAGALIQDFCNSNENIELIGECTYQAGGCLILAKALTSIFPESQLFAVMSKGEEKVQHFVCRIDSTMSADGYLYLDADGMATIDDLNTKFKDQEIGFFNGIDVLPATEVVVPPDIIDNGWEVVAERLAELDLMCLIYPEDNSPRQ